MFKVRLRESRYADRVITHGCDETQVGETPSTKGADLQMASHVYIILPGIA